MAAESKLDAYLRNYANTTQFLYLKLNIEGEKGYPDRLIIGTNGRMGFMELKAPGGKPKPHQERKINELRRRGFKVEVIDNFRQGGEFMNSLLRSPNLEKKP